MDLHRSIHRLLKEIGPGRMESVAYDTAWVARLARLGEPIGEQALEWLREHQLPDGSWGAAEPIYYYDRLVCTLAAMLALAKGNDKQDEKRLHRAKSSLEWITQRLRTGASSETIGFEMLVPALLSEAKALGVVSRCQDDHLMRLTRYREAKLATLPNGVINRLVSVAFSAEMAGADGIHLFDVENLTERNHSVATSPSATAYYVLHVKRGDESSLGYLRSVVNDDGGMPDVAPFDIFERAWTLWNLAISGSLDEKCGNLAQEHVEFLRRAWDPRYGVGHTVFYTPNEGDDTSLTYDTLRRYGSSVPIDAVLYYEENDHFRCFDLEANPSISTNIHVLGALRQFGLSVEHPSVQKVLRFLQRVQTAGMFWFDKWHVSPYYPTSHAIIACAGYADDLVNDAVYWILATQRSDGAWGYYSATAEESAYCLLALIHWQRAGGQVPKSALERGFAWLAAHSEPPYPPLWIGKCLYCPEDVVRSAVLSALMLRR